MGNFVSRLFGNLLERTTVFYILLLFVHLTAWSVEVNQPPAPTPVTQESVVKLEWTAEEKKWLKAHKNIVLAFDGSLPPYSFVNDNGEIDGIAVEIMAILSMRTGITFTVYPESDWVEIYKAAAKHKIDVVATMVKRQERAEWFIFTKPYLTKSLVIVTHQDNNSISNREDIKDKKVAVVKGYQYSEMLVSEFPTVKRVNAESMLDSLNLVSSRQVDAAVLFYGTANYLEAKHNLQNLKVAAFFDRNSANESMAVRKDWPQLLAILQKGLDSLGEEEVKKIFDKWIVGQPQPVPDLNQQQTIPSPVPENVQPKPENAPQIAETANVQTESAGQNSAPSHPINFWLLFGAIAALIMVMWLILLYRLKKISAKNVSPPKRETTVQTGLSPTDLPLQTDPIYGDATPAVKAEPTTIPATPIHHDLASEMVQDARQYESDHIIYQHDGQGHLHYVSASVTRLLGYTETDFMLNYRNYLTDHPDNQHIDVYTLNCLQGHPVAPYNIEIYDARRVKRCFEVLDTPVYDGQGHCIGVDGVMREIIDIKPAKDHVLSPETDLMDSVMTSSLPVPTGSVPSLLLSSLNDAVKESARNNKPFILLMVALERIRLLDGGLIENPPPELLEEADKRLQSTLRGTDTIVKQENLHYALILGENEIGAVSLIVDKIKKMLQIPYLVGIESMVLDANIGSAHYPVTSQDVESLILAAQPVRAENNPSMAENPLTSIEQGDQNDENFRLQQELLQALDECKIALRASSPQHVNALSRHSQFVIHYQSRHDGADFSIVGFEALIRWNHPRLGLLMPRDFIGLVKELGMLDVLTYWVIRQVSLQALSWEGQGLRPKHLAITINLEDLTVKRAVDVSKIMTLINETGAKPEWLQFSIPEKEIANDPDRLIPIIKQFVNEGMVVAIDNFGSAGSILEMMNEIPASIVEIDPEFIRGLPNNADDAEIVSLTVAMLHDLGKTVIAKEVETENQLNSVKESGCDILQGHLLSRPLPAQEAKELMKNLPNMIWFLLQK